MKQKNTKKAAEKIVVHDNNTAPDKSYRKQQREKKDSATAEDGSR